MIETEPVLWLNTLCTISLSKSKLHVHKQPSIAWKKKLPIAITEHDKTSFNYPSDSLATVDMHISAVILNLKYS